MGPATARVLPDPGRHPPARPAAGKARTSQLVNGLDLHALLDTPVRQLSLGERMRGEVAAALVHRPRLLVLDEPTIGLDMISKERLRQFLIAERNRATSPLLLTTHDMSDIERLCERVLVVDRGRLVYDGTLPQLAARVALQRVLVVDLWEPHPALDVRLRNTSVVSSTGCVSGWRSRPSRPPRPRWWRRLGADRGPRPDAGGAGDRGHRPDPLLPERLAGLRLSAAGRSNGSPEPRGRRITR